MNKYERLIEHIINDETDKARALFHQIVVEKSRDIYESLVDEEDLGGNKVNDLVDEVTCDEEGMNEEEDQYGDTSAWSTDQDDEEVSDFDHDEDPIGGDEFGDENVGGETSVDELKDITLDLRAAIDDLNARFEELMADEQNEPEHHDGIDDPEFGSDDSEFDSEENESGSEDNDFDHQELGESCDEEEEEEEDSEEDLEETLVREYVEKVGDMYKSDMNPSEGKFVGKDGSTAINKKSINAKPNRMGGESLKFGEAGVKDPNGTTAQKGENNAYKKGQGELELGKRNVNQPGGKGADTFYSKKQTSYEKAKGKEGQTTSGKLPVNTKSEIGGKVR